jgi:N6-adenosine-specific RNA methylase IME4
MGQDKSTFRNGGLAVPESAQQQILRVEQAKQLLALARTVREAKEIRDQAVAVAHYMKVRGGSEEAADDAAEIKLWAERRLGELLVQTVNHNGARGVGNTMLSTLPEDVRPIQSSRWQKVASIPEPEFVAEIAKRRGTKEGITTHAVLKLAQAKEKQAKIEAIAKEPAPLPKGPFRVIVVDPPWAYVKRTGDISHRGALSYPTMSVKEIKAIQVPDFAATDCILWLWTTNAFMRQALEVIDAWGFKEKTILTWVKDRMGTGDWLRGRTEHCLLTIRGMPVVNLTNQTTVMESLRREHSRKPDEFYALVEALCPGSKLEMFSRADERKGWTLHGNESGARRERV